MKKVTIIMGAYNAASSVGRAIDSIIRQTYKDWILLICDDGSIDNTLEILEVYREKHPNQIKVFINKENMGLTYTLNRLIREVETEYTARMDADDVCSEDRLHMQMEFLEHHKEYAMAGTSINKYDENGIYETKIYKEKPKKKDFLWNNPFAHPTIIIRTIILKELNGYRDIRKTVRCEDYDLWFRLYRMGYRGYNLKEPLLDYYEGKDSFVKRKFRYRLNEARVRMEGYLSLGMMPIGVIYAVKPIFVGLISVKNGKLLLKLRK